MIKNIIYSKFKTIVLPIILIAMSACSTKNSSSSATPTPPPNMEIQTFGLLKFGSVVVGDFRQTQVTLTNHTSDFAPFNPIVTYPFAITNVSYPCSIGKIPAGGTCSFNLNFSPSSNGEFSTTLKFGDSSVSFTGKGLQGGDILVSETNINLGTIGAGVQTIKNLTLTNTGDFTVNFPTFLLGSEYKLLSNYCGSAIDPKQSCQINFSIIKTNLGTQTDSVTMTSTSKGSGTTTIPLTFSSIVTPGAPNGNISFDGTLPGFIADGVQSSTVVSGQIKDIFGNIVLSGTTVTVVLNNLSLVEPSNIFPTDSSGRITFHIKTKTTKGNATISMFSGNAFGSIPIYVAAGLPYGTITLQPYNPNLIADGLTQLILRTNTIFDKYGNIIEDGTQLPVSAVGGGNVSTNGIVYAPALTASSFAGAVQFTLKSGTVTGNITVQIRANPVLDSNLNITDYAAKGDFPLVYIPGPAYGVIPISSGKNGINAVSDFTLVSIGPVKDITGNIVAQGTPLNVSIENGVNLSATGSVLNTDTAGMVTFQLAGSGNRGPIIITAKTINANGFETVWAYKDSHLTLQGQKRDDWGFGNGDNGINSGRMAIRYYKATNDPTLFPPVKDVWDEIFDYTKLSSSDRVYYDIERFNGNPISTLGTDPGNTFPVVEPTSSTISSKFIDFAGPNPVAIPYYQSPIWYPAGNTVIAAPFWSVTAPPAASTLVGCSETAPDSFGNYLYNELMFTITNGLFGCSYNGSVVTTNATVDRTAKDERSNFYYPSIGYAEEPLACSFDSSQSPVFSFNLGTFVIGNDTTRQIKITNPNPNDLTNLAIAFSGVIDPNWTFTDVDCGTSLASQASCTINVSYNNNAGTKPSQYSSALTINSNAVSANVLLSVTMIGTGTPPPSSGILGLVTMKTNCYAKLIDFGGYNYQWQDANKRATVSTSSKLLSSYNSRGQIISRYDNNCDSYVTQTSCQAGNGCLWSQREGSDPATFQCSNVTDLGSFPSKGKAYTPFVAVGKTLYSFGGFDATGDGQPSSDGLLQLNTETGVWSGLSPDPDNSIPLSPTYTGEPLARYEHGMVYVPETTSLYIYGGVGITAGKNGQQPTPVYFNDLWQVNLNPAPVVDPITGESSTPSLQWKRICDNCVSVDPSNLFTSIKRNPVQPGPGFSFNPGVATLMWNKARKQVYVYWSSRSYVYSFDPTASNIVFTAIDSSSGANFLASSYQVLYNPRQERMYAYFQGDPNSNILPSLKMWDMDANEKVYTKTRFQLGNGSKQWATILSPRIKAYGSAGADPSCGDPCPGVSAYIYNYATLTWDLIGNNTALNDTALNTQGEITNSWINKEAQNHVSSDGFVDILVSPNGNPLNYNQIHVDSIYLDGTF